MVSKKPLTAIRLGFAVLLALCLSLSIFGAANITKPSAPAARETIARGFVSSTLRTWQSRLDLNDWKITVDLVRASALEPKTLGNIHWDSNLKQASIRVLSSYDYALTTPDMLDDMEFTIVHELMHLHLASLPHTDASRAPEEHAVNELARAFIRLAEKRPALSSAADDATANSANRSDK